MECEVPQLGAEVPDEAGHGGDEDGGPPVGVGPRQQRSLHRDGHDGTGTHQRGPGRQTNAGTISQRGEARRCGQDPVGCPGVGGARRDGPGLTRGVLGPGGDTPRAGIDALHPGSDRDTATVGGDVLHCARSLEAVSKVAVDCAHP